MIPETPAEKAFEEWHKRCAACCEQCAEKCPHKIHENQAYLAAWGAREPEVKALIDALDNLVRSTAVWWASSDSLERRKSPWYKSYPAALSLMKKIKALGPELPKEG